MIKSCILYKKFHTLRYSKKAPAHAVGDPGEGWSRQPPRAGRIGTEYRRKARNADRKYNGTLPGVCGPVQTRLKTYGHIWGLAIGPRGEISKDLERLIEATAKIGAERKWRAMGSRSQREAAAVLKNSMRRRIGVVAVRENARLKRERLAIILSPDGGAAAAGRRAAAYGHFNARDEQDMFHFTGRRE